MLDTSARLLRLLSLLQSRRDWASADLADRLGVAVRTVRRDVDRLRSLGYPVHATPGVSGGYRLGAGAQLPPLLLDDDEAVAVAVGLRTAAGGTVAGIEETSVRALAKLEQVLPSRLRRRVNALQTATVSIPRSGPTVDPDVLTVIAAACRDHERLRFDYLRHDGTASLRLVEPHSMVSSGRRWYLLAWDTERQDWRTFRVDRLTPRTPAGPRFIPREPPTDAADFVANRLGTEMWEYQTRVRLHAPAAAMAGLTSGLVEPLDDQTCVLTLGGESLHAVAVALGFLNVDFTVLDPPELLDHVQQLATRYARATRRS